MKSRAFGMILFLSLGLCACAVTAHRHGADGVDYAQVLAVNQWAAHRHATVVWVRYPQARTSRSDD